MSPVSARRLALAALASAAVSGVAGAQPFTERFVSAGKQAASPPAGSACGTPISASGPGVTSAACTFAGGEFSVRARALDGRVGAYAGVTGSALGGPTSTIFSTTARGQWGDRFTFTDVVPATVRLDVVFDGLLSGSATGGAGANVMAAWNFQASSRGVVGADYSDTREIAAVGNPIFGGQPDVAETVFIEKSFLVPILPTGTTAPPSLDFLLNLFAKSTVVVGSEPGGATAISDFDHTGLIASLAFFDAAGVDITSTVTYVSSRGTLIGPVVTAAPEPATLALVAGGLVALAAALPNGRRRSRTGA